MRRLMRCAARLYPAAWRARYGDELDVLMEDAGPRWTDLFDLFRGAITMQMTSLNFWKIAAGFTVAGALAAGAWSLTLQDRYVSTAVLRLGEPAAGSALEVRQRMQVRLQALQQTVFSRNSLSTIIQQQKLYEKERASLPLEDIIQTMRNRDIRSMPLHDTQFTVSFANRDPSAAQATVRAVVAALVEANVNVDRPHALNLEVIEPASLPASATGPDRARLIRNGLLAGLVLGVLFGTLWTIIRGRKQASLLRIGAFAAAGMAVGLTIAVLIPDQFVSTAVLRTTDGDKMPAVLQAALSEAALGDVILKYGLYPSERRSIPMAKVAGKMRDTAIRVQTVAIPMQSESRTLAFVVSFTYPDRDKAQAVTHDLVARISGSLPAEVLDPPSMPQAPSYPNRLTIAGFGLFAGTLLGLAATRFRRTPLATA